MTSRERLLITLRGGLADRVPVAPFVQEEYLSFYYPDRLSVDRVKDAAERRHILAAIQNADDHLFAGQSSGDI